jgi:FlgD Ig-like domain
MKGMTMKLRTSLVSGLLALAGVVALASTAPAQMPVESVLRVYPVGEFTCVAAEFEVGPGAAISGLNWYNNDELATFPNVILLEGAAGAGPDLNDAGLLLADISGGSLTWGKLTLPQPVASSTGTIYAVFVLPAGGELTAQGSGGGAGVGVTQDASAPRFYMSQDGAEWTRFDHHYGLAVQLVQTQLKGEPVALASLKGALGSEWNALAKEPTPTIPERTEFYAPSPNPFNPAVTLSFALSQPSKTTLVVYDIRGRRVRTVVDQELKAGPHSFVWQGRDRRGAVVSSGVYLVRFEGGGLERTSRVVLVK